MRWVKYKSVNGDVYLIEAEDNFNNVLDHILDTTKDNIPLQNALLDMLTKGIEGFVIIKEGSAKIKYDENLHYNLLK